MEALPVVILLFTEPVVLPAGTFDTFAITELEMRVERGLVVLAPAREEDMRFETENRLAADEGQAAALDDPDGKGSGGVDFGAAGEGGQQPADPIPHRSNRCVAMPWVSWFQPRAGQRRIVPKRRGPAIHGLA